MPVDKVTVALNGNGPKVEMPRDALKFFPAYKETARSKGGASTPSSNAKAVTAAKES